MKSPNAKISNHAKDQMDERSVSEEMVLDVLRNPDQKIAVNKNKMVFQAKKYFDDAERMFLVRVFVNTLKNPNLVITVYRTSKIDKYWRYED